MQTGPSVSRGLTASACIVLLGVALPVAAVAPLALIAKEVVSGIVRSLAEDLLHGALMAAMGPCDGAIASTALNTAQGFASMRGGAVPSLPPGLGVIPGGMPAMPGGISGMPGGVPGASGAMPGMAGGLMQMLGGGIGPGGLPIGGMSGLLPSSGRLEDMPAPMREMILEERREYRESQRARGLTQAQIEEEDREVAETEVESERLVQAMMNDQRPLSTAELDEFIELYAKYSPMMPGGAACTPASLRRLLTVMPVSSMPMAAGPLRMVTASLREMDKQFAESRHAYAQMTPAERAENLDLITAEMTKWPPAQRDAFASLLKTDLLGMPTDMRDELARRLR